MKKIIDLIIAAILIVIFSNLIGVYLHFHKIDVQLKNIKEQTENFTKERERIMQEFYNSERKEVVWTNSL